MLSSVVEQCLTAISEFMVLFYWTCRLRGQRTKHIEDVLLVVVNLIYCIVVRLVFTTCSFRIELLIIFGEISCFCGYMSNHIVFESFVGGWLLLLICFVGNGWHCAMR